jgi:hypothetical protein
VCHILVHATIKIKPSQFLIKQQAVKFYGEVEVYLQSLALALDGGEQPASRPGPFTPYREGPQYPLDGSGVAQRSGSSSVTKRTELFKGLS